MIPIEPNKLQPDELQAVQQLHKYYENILRQTGGVIVGLEDVIERGYHPLVFRHFVLTAHYRSKMNFSFEALDAAEAWHYHAGAPLKLEIAADAKGPLECVTLGADLAAGERPQAIVPAHAWQAAQSLGEWTLVSCTVAPGFDFKGFELAPKDWAPSALK